MEESQAFMYPDCPLTMDSTSHARVSAPDTFPPQDAYYAPRDPDSEREVLTAITAIPSYAVFSFEELRYEQRKISFLTPKYEDLQISDSDTEPAYAPVVARDYKDYGRLVHSISAHDAFAHVSCEELRYLDKLKTMYTKTATEYQALLNDTRALQQTPKPIVGWWGKPRYMPTLLESEVEESWPFAVAITAMDAFADKSFEELRYEDRNAPNEWRRVVLVSRKAPMVSLMELRVRGVVGRFMNRSTTWYKELKEPEQVMRCMERYTSDWCAITMQETINGWYPTTDQRFQEYMDTVVRSSEGTERPVVPASLEWIDRHQSVGGRLDEPTLQSIDPFAFLGYYCVQSRIAIRLVERHDGFTWRNALDELLGGIGELAAKLTSQLVDKVDAANTNEHAHHVVEAILHVDETRAEMLLALQNHARRIHEYLTVCKQFALEILELRRQDAEQAHKNEAVLVAAVDSVLIRDPGENAVVGNALRDEVDRLRRELHRINDWSCAESNQVVRIVDPHLAAADYRKSRQVPSLTSLPLNAKLDPYARMCAIAFQNTIPVGFNFGARWIPGDVVVDADWRAAFASYIHNLHPKSCRALYDQLEKILTGMIPSFEQVVWSLKQGYPLMPWFNTSPLSTYIVDCLCQRPSPSRTLPSVRSWQPTTWNLRGCHLQVVVRMEEIIVSESLPAYTESDAFRVGLEIGDIAAVGLFCYDAVNIATASVSFSYAPDCNPYVFPWLPQDRKSSAAFYGISRRHQPSLFFPLTPCRVGKVSLHEERMIVWPSTYQTRIESVEWGDLTGNGESGSLKLVWFYLVSVGSHILSTAEVPPHQPTWSTMSTDELAAKFHLPDSAVALILAFSNAHFRNDDNHAH